jgi:hypothetical protein
MHSWLPYVLTYQSFKSREHGRICFNGFLTLKMNIVMQGTICICETVIHKFYTRGITTILVNEIIFGRQRNERRVIEGHFFESGRILDFAR